MTNLKKVLLTSAALTLMSGAAYAAGNNSATNTQNGDSNTVNITQTSGSRGHDATSNVTGDSNNVLVIQENVEPGSNGYASTDVNVTGLNGGQNNNITVQQRVFNQTAQENRPDKDATIDVYGDRNRVNANQQYGVAAGNPAFTVGDNILKVTIRGDDEGNENNIDVFQTNNGQSSNTFVWGDNNKVNVNQVAGGSKSTINIDGGTANGDDGEGHNNQLSVDQYSGDTQTASSTVYGDYNTGSIRQGGGTGNSATVNIGNSLLDGDNNTFAVDQFGSTNTVNGTIEGNYNLARINQTGNLNKATFLQSGDSNTLGVVQQGDSNTLISNQIGHNNTAYVSQLSNGNSYTNTQTGNYNYSSITQN